MLTTKEKIPNLKMYVLIHFVEYHFSCQVHSLIPLLCFIFINYSFSEDNSVFPASFAIGYVLAQTLSSDASVNMETYNFLSPMGTLAATLDHNGLCL